MAHIPTVKLLRCFSRKPVFKYNTWLKKKCFHCGIVRATAQMPPTDIKPKQVANAPVATTSSKIEKISRAMQVYISKAKEHEPTKISTTASANDEYPDTNTSPVPASITAASVSEAVTDVFQDNSTRAGQYLMVSVPVQQGRKTIRKEYGAVVLQVQEDDIEVRYLRQKDGKYYFPDTEDDAWIVHADIVGHLDIAQMASRVFH